MMFIDMCQCEGVWLVVLFYGISSLFGLMLNLLILEQCLMFRLVVLFYGMSTLFGIQVFYISKHLFVVISFVALDRKIVVFVLDFNMIDFCKRK